MASTSTRGMFDVLVYLFETYYAADAAPDQDALTRTLSDAGFPNDDINDALAWLRGLAEPEPEVRAAETALDHSAGCRIFSRTETSRLSRDCRGFLMFLESAGVLGPTLREIIIERALALESDTVTIDQLKVIVLMVLWTREGSLDSLILEELLPDGEPRHVH